MTVLTDDAAWALLEGSQGVSRSGTLLQCRVNFFEAALVAPLPEGLGLVRQDMLGNRQAHLFRRAEIDQVEVTEGRKKRRALRFGAAGVVWQLDRLTPEDFEVLLDHLAGGAALVPDPATPAAPRAGSDSADAAAADAAAADAAVPSPAGPAPDPAPEASVSPEAAPGVEVTVGLASMPTRGTAPDAPRPDPPGEGGPGASSSGLAPGGSAPPVHVERSQTPVDRLLDLLDEAAGTAISSDEIEPLVRRIFHQSQRIEQTDRALLAAQALLALGKAGPLERQLAEHYQTQRLLTVSRPLAPEEIQAIRPMETADIALMRVAAACVPGLIRMTARPPGDFGLKGPPEGAEQLAFGRVFSYTRHALGLDGIGYHPHPEGPKGMRFANLVHRDRSYPTLVVGSDFLSGRTEMELSFWIGHELSFLWPEHLLRVLVPELSSQAVLILTAVAMAEPEQPLPGGQEQAIRAQLSHLTRYMELDDFEAVSAAVRHLLAQPEPFDLARWNRAVEASALRAGLLLSGDVGVACRALASLDLPSAQHQIARVELLRFALGDLHQSLRSALGLAVA